MGGKSPHMLHPYEDPEIVFQSLEDLFEHVALNGLEGTIKRDGQNLVVSYSLARDQAVAIRNDDHVFVKGMGLDGEGPTENFADYLAHSQKDWKRLRDGGNRNKKATPPHIVKAFSKALEELELVARSLPQKTALELFGEDADIFYNAEVMSPISRNAIEYDVDTLSIHRILHHLYDEEKRELDTLGAADSNVRADALNKALEDYYRNTDTTYDPRDPKLTPGVSVGAMEHLASLADAGVAEAAISDLRQYYTSYGMSAGDTLGRLVFKVFRDAVDQLPSIGPEAQKKLVIRMFQEVYTKDVYSEIDSEESIIHDFGPRTSRLTEGKVHIKEILKLSLDQDPMTLKAIGDLKDEAKPLHLQAITPLVNILFEFSSHALGALRDLYVLNRDTEIERTRDDVLKTIANLAKSLDPITLGIPSLIRSFFLSCSMYAGSCLSEVGHASLTTVKSLRAASLKLLNRSRSDPFSPQANTIVAPVGAPPDSAGVVMKSCDSLMAPGRTITVPFKPDTYRSHKLIASEVDSFFPAPTVRTLFFGLETRTRTSSFSGSILLTMLKWPRWGGLKEPGNNTIRGPTVGTCSLSANGSGTSTASVTGSACSHLEGSMPNNWLIGAKSPVNL